MNNYYIVYNPATFDFMALNATECRSTWDLVTFLTHRNASELGDNNYLNYLKFDPNTRREAMAEVFGLENSAAIYVGNQVGRLAPASEVVQADDLRITLPDVINRRGNPPAAVFITSISSNFPTAAAASIVLNRVRIPVVLGGIHVSTALDDVETFIRAYCAYPELVSEVRGPGDSQVIGEILQDLEHESLKREYSGHTTIEDGVWRTPENVEALPPMWMDVGKRVPWVGRLLDNKIRTNPVAPLLGCPYSCSFCSISTLPANQRRLSIRTPEDFLDELESHEKGQDDVTFPVFLFCTDNLLLGRESLDAMLDGMIARKLRAPFVAQISIEVASNDELLDRMRRAGALLFEIGFESLDMDNLEHISKHCRHEIRELGLTVPEYYSKQIAKIQAHGISIQGSFIFGLPHDRFNTIDDSTGTDVAHFCIDNRISLMAGCFSAEPGARDFEECLEAGKFLYGEPGTIEYLRALCIADHSEMNVMPSEDLKRSPLLVGLMALDALRRVSKTRNALRNAVYMAKKSYACPTALGRASHKERIYDSTLSFLSELLTARFYGDIGERLVASRNGTPGVMARLYRYERNGEVRQLCERYAPELL